MAIMVSVGFPDPLWGNVDPPVINKFGMSQCCSQGFSTLLSRDAPMIVPP